MKNILTIAATAGLLSAFASSVQAQITLPPVSVGGNVTLSCIISSSSGGILAENSLPASVLTNTAAVPNQGSVTVKCNSGLSTLTLTQGPHIIPTQNPTPTVAVSFASGTGVYSNLSSGTSASALEPTSSAGDTAKFSTTVTAGSGKLLKVGAYTIFVTATVTPL
jgi:hypothetical protein